MSPGELLARWRADAAVLRSRGCADAARLLEGCADELDRALAAGAGEALPLREAAQLSGYSVAHLRRLIAEGHLRNVATSGRPLVRRGDLPRKPGLRLA